MTLASRAKDDTPIVYVSPWVELNAGLWSLFAGATFFLALRVWCKLTRRHGLWYDDYILIVSWTVLFANIILIVYEFATGYILADTTQKWDDRMHILINVSSIGTVIGQALTKTAFAVTLLRLCNRWQKYILWFCIATMNLWMILRCVFQWAKVCNVKSYQQWYRLDFCIGDDFRDDFKMGGNVYNIIMDFVLALFPWIITRDLEMRRIEKIGLCATMSLGIIVATVAAARVGWKDDGNSRDAYYIWRNGVSQVWYTSEVAGTIIVQCIPILRTMLKEMHTSMMSKRLRGSSQETSNRTKLSVRRASSSIYKTNEFSSGNGGKGAEVIILRNIPEESGGQFGIEAWSPPPRPARSPAPFGSVNSRGMELQGAPFGKTMMYDSDSTDEDEKMRLQRQENLQQQQRQQQQQPIPLPSAGAYIEESQTTQGWNSEPQQKQPQPYTSTSSSPVIPHNQWPSHARSSNDSAATSIYSLITPQSPLSAPRSPRSPVSPRSFRDWETQRTSTWTGRPSTGSTLRFEDEESGLSPPPPGGRREPHGWPARSEGHRGRDQWS